MKFVRRRNERNSGGNNNESAGSSASVVVFHDWFVPEGLQSHHRQKITRAESLARQKAEEVVAGGKEAIVAKGTEASNLKGRAKKRAARAEIHRRQRLLEEVR